MNKRIFKWLLWFPALPAYADLPEMEDPHAVRATASWKPCRTTAMTS